MSNTAERINPAESTRTLVVERVFPHPPEKLWRALTESPLLAQWMMNNDFEPVVGRKFQFRADPVPNWNGVIDCEVLIVDPLQRLSYNWGVGGSESGLQWVVLWTLTPAEGGTHVRMEQSGFRPDQQAGVSGRKLRLAEILRRPGACAQRRCSMSASDSMMNFYAMKVSEKKASRALVAGFWIFTALFCVQMVFTAYYELLVLPQVAAGIHPPRLPRRLRSGWSSHGPKWQAWPHCSMPMVPRGASST